MNGPKEYELIVIDLVGKLSKACLGIFVVEFLPHVWRGQGPLELEFYNMLSPKLFLRSSNVLQFKVGCRSKHHTLGYHFLNPNNIQGVFCYELKITVILLKRGRSSSQPGLYPSSASSCPSRRSQVHALYRLVLLIFFSQSLHLQLITVHFNQSHFQLLFIEFCLLFVWPLG